MQVILTKLFTGPYFVLASFSSQVQSNLINKWKIFERFYNFIFILCDVSSQETECNHLGLFVFKNMILDIFISIK